MRGRPCKSLIRENILVVVSHLKKAYGYQIFHHYRNIFPKVHMRSIYYHLKKGVEREELQLHEVKEEKGDYSWGKQVEKTYYTLGKKAKVKASKKAQAYFTRVSSKNP